MGHIPWLTKQTMIEEAGRTTRFQMEDGRCKWLQSIKLQETWRNLNDTCHRNILVVYVVKNARFLDR